MAVGGEDVLDGVLVAHRDAGDAPAAAVLGAVDVVDAALDVAAVGERDEDVDFGDQVLLGKCAGDVLDAGAALVAVLLLERVHVVADDAEDLLRIGQEGFQAA